MSAFVQFDPCVDYRTLPKNSPRKHIYRLLSRAQRPDDVIAIEKYFNVQINMFNRRKLFYRFSRRGQFSVAFALRASHEHEINLNGSNDALLVSMYKYQRYDLINEYLDAIQLDKYIHRDIIDNIVVSMIDASNVVSMIDASNVNIDTTIRMIVKYLGKTNMLTEKTVIYAIGCCNFDFTLMLMTYMRSIVSTCQILLSVLRTNNIEFINRFLRDYPENIIISAVLLNTRKIQIDCTSEVLDLFIQKINDAGILNKMYKQVIWDDADELFIRIFALKTPDMYELLWRMVECGSCRIMKKILHRYRRDYLYQEKLRKMIKFTVENNSYNIALQLVQHFDIEPDIQLIMSTINSYNLFTYLVGLCNFTFDALALNQNRVKSSSDFIRSIISLIESDRITGDIDILFAICFKYMTLKLINKYTDTLFIRYNPLEYGAIINKLIDRDISHQIFNRARIFMRDGRVALKQQSINHMMILNSYDTVKYCRRHQIIMATEISLALQHLPVLLQIHIFEQTTDYIPENQRLTMWHCWEIAKLISRSNF